MKTRPQAPYIVDDHPLIRDGMALLIGSQRDLQVCGSAGSIREALQQISKTPPDVMVVDLSLKDGLGLDLIKSVIVMGTHGHTGRDQLLLGSVAEHVVRNAPCAVLTLRPGAGWSLTQEKEEAEEWCRKQD